MKRLAMVVAAFSSAAALGQSTEHGTHADMAAPLRPMILDGYGGGGFPITTTSPQAQAYFDNGMQLAHAFAHKAAVAAMQEAERLDPTCAMCVWGEAWAGGPTINFGKDGDELKHLTELAATARSLAREHGTPKERALTNALVSRYRNGGGGKPGDIAFAKAMQRLADRYQQDDELATIAADAWLIALSHNTPETDSPAGAKAMPLLDRVLKRHPDYTPAIHFYIHATEAIGKPGLAEPYADRLAALAPKASHLIHMPSHTYYWVGRYQDAANANRRAVEIGITQAQALGAPPPDGVFGLPYHMHNVVFGLGGALMAGDKETALWLGRPLVLMSTAKSDASPFRQTIAGAGFVAMAIFADPQEVLALAEPKLPYLKGFWHYARGEAFARLNQSDKVRAEAAAILTPQASKDADDGSWFASQTMHIAQLVLDGRAKMLDGRPAEAAKAFEAAATLQEQKDYSYSADPPLWWFPVRRAVAEAKLAAGDSAGARAAAQEALKLRARDPAALALLAKLDALAASR